MGKQSKKPGKDNKGIKLETTQQSNAYSELVKKQHKVLSAGYQTQLAQKSQKIQGKNEFSAFRKPTGTTFINFTHTLDSLQSNTYDFDPKQSKDHHYNPKKRAEQIKDLYTDPLTANQTYGWRPPIDVFPTSFGLKGTLGQSSLKSTQKSKKK